MSAFTSLSFTFKKTFFGLIKSVVIECVVYAMLMALPDVMLSIKLFYKKISKIFFSFFFLSSRWFFTPEKLSNSFRLKIHPKRKIFCPFDWAMNVLRYFVTWFSFFFFFGKCMLLLSIWIELPPGFTTRLINSIQSISIQRVRHDDVCDSDAQNFKTFYNFWMMNMWIKSFYLIL